jgi:hypothetical protein
MESMNGKDFIISRGENGTDKDADETYGEDTGGRFCHSDGSGESIICAKPKLRNLKRESWAQLYLISTTPAASSGISIVSVTNFSLYTVYRRNPIEGYL